MRSPSTDKRVGAGGRSQGLEPQDPSTLWSNPYAPAAARTREAITAGHDVTVQWNPDTAGGVDVDEIVGGARIQCGLARL
jgi:hypothetical protein